MTSNRHGLTIITGGPGRGKTMCLKHALDMLDARGVKYELCSPSGKAAKRMQEATDRESQTIHRLLAYHPEIGFRRCAEWPLETRVVFMDESSMLDIELAAAFFTAVKPGRTRVVMIGDVDQLPPVGPGRVFGDLIDSGLVKTARLTKLHRSAAGSWVAVNAPRVLTGGPLDLEPRADFRFVRVASAVDVAKAVCAVAAEHKADRKRSQVLVPQKAGDAGIESLNGALQRILNPLESVDELHIRRKKYVLHTGDRVIQTRNDYQRNVFNGEAGEIASMVDGEIVVDFEEARGARAVTYSNEATEALTLAYALTIHKSQGSEFDHVIAVVHSSHAHMLSRQLFYTAITRAKKSVTIIGDDKGIKGALSNGRVEKRNTTLIERLKGELDDVIDDSSYEGGAA
jgi:exodeoxyribonuclease V alpha subunit